MYSFHLGYFIIAILFTLAILGILIYAKVTVDNSDFATNGCNKNITDQYTFISQQLLLYAIVAVSILLAFEILIPLVLYLNRPTYRRY
jgi:hypothetical protein